MSQVCPDDAAVHSGKQSSCLTVTTGEWVCRQRKRTGECSQEQAPDARETRYPVETDGAPTTTKWMADVTTALAPTLTLSLIHISEPTRLGMISYAVFCL